MDTDTTPAAPPAGGIEDGDFSRLCGDGFDPGRLTPAPADTAAQLGEVPADNDDESDIYNYRSVPPKRLYTVQVTLNYRGRLPPARYDLEPE